MFRTRISWIGFALVSLLAALFSVGLLFHGFSPAAINVQMDRDSALTRAREIAEWKVAESRSWREFCVKESIHPTGRFATSKKGRARNTDSLCS